MPDSLTDWQTLKDRATQLLIKYKSGALVTQYAPGVRGREKKEHEGSAVDSMQKMSKLPTAFLSLQKV